MVYIMGMKNIGKLQKEKFDKGFANIDWNKQPDKKEKPDTTTIQENLDVKLSDFYVTR